MTEEQTQQHFDETKHTRFEVRFGWYVCLECQEINNPILPWYDGA